MSYTCQRITQKQRAVIEHRVFHDLAMQSTKQCPLLRGSYDNVIVFLFAPEDGGPHRFMLHHRFDALPLFPIGGIQSNLLPNLVRMLQPLCLPWSQITPFAYLVLYMSMDYVYIQTFRCPDSSNVSPDKCIGLLLKQVSPLISCVLMRTVICIHKCRVQ